MSERCRFAIASANPELKNEYYREGYWRSEDLWASFERIATRHADAIAFVEGDRSITFDRLLEQAARFGTAAQQSGLSHGDVVAIHGRHCIEGIVAILGCAYARLVAALLPAMFSSQQIASILESTHAKCLLEIGEPADYDKAKAAIANRHIPLFIIADNLRETGNAVCWRAFLRRQRDQLLERAPMDADELAILIFSSGTTGAPKGVMHSTNTARFAAEVYGRAQGITADDVCLIVLAFGFVGSSILGVLLPLLLGSRGILLRHWQVEDTLRLVEQHRVSHTLLMPTHAVDILKSAELAETDCNSLTRGVLAGLTMEQRQEAARTFCCLPLPMYGMSESPGHVTGRMDDSAEGLLSNEGRAIPGTEVSICDDNDRPLPPGEEGNILVRGPNRFLGYFHDDETNGEVLTDDGFFRSGDIGVIDTNGYMTFVSRKKDIIRRAGITILPADIEAAVAQHPRVRDVAVIAVPEPRLGEQACACVVTNDGLPMSLKEITVFLEKREFARYSWPEHIFVFPELPRTPSLKVKKNELYDRVFKVLTSDD